MTNRNWLEASALSIDDVLTVLPHRYPFLMIDRVLEIKTAKPLRLGMTDAEINDARTGSFARAIKNVSGNEPQFQGHFPENPVFPGVLSLEALAQAAAFVTVPFVAAMHGGALPRLAVALVGIDGARFRRPVRPGDQLELRVTCAHTRGQIWGFDGEALVEGKKVAEGSFLAHLSAGGSGAAGGA